MSLDIWLTATRPTTVFDTNYTHNVTPMWRKAGCYDALYKSEGLTAIAVLPAIESGVASMREQPEAYKALNPENGWGNYESALRWLEELRDVFRANPDGVIGVST